MKRTQKEIKPIIKNEVDAFVLELMKKFPEIEGSSLENYVAEEVRGAIYEIKNYGKVLSNKERWG